MEFFSLLPTRFRIKPAVSRLTFCLSLSLTVACALDVQAQIKPEDLHVMQGSVLEAGHQDMLLNYLLRQAGAATEKRQGPLQALRSESDIKKWSDANRQKFLELIGGLPGDRTPLNARVVGEVARDGYVVRKVIFESLPEFYVTANLYVPTVGKPPYPAILSPCGHSENGKAYDVYQHLYIGLVKRGYVVLTYDPLGQGERIEYWDFLSNRQAIRLQSAWHGGYPGIFARPESCPLFHLGWDARSGLSDQFAGSRRFTRGRDRKLGRRHPDHLHHHA